MKELDLLLERWLRSRYELATAAEQAGFEALLELPDPQLLRYLLRGELPLDPGMAAAVKRVLASPDIMLRPTAEPSANRPL